MSILSRLRDMARNLAVEPRRVVQEPVQVAPRVSVAARPLTSNPVDVNETAVGETQALPPVTHRKTGKAGIDLMHQFEGCEKKRPDGRFEAYLCPAGVWTIGWGSTGSDPFNGEKIRRGTVWTREQCDLRFEMHLAQFEEYVREGLGKAPASQAQFDAMVALCYNIGPGDPKRDISGFLTSTVLRKHIAGDYPGAAKAFLMWNKAGGKVLRGLTRRREAEAALYWSGS